MSLICCGALDADDALTKGLRPVWLFGDVLSVNGAFEAAATRLITNLSLSLASISKCDYF